MLVGAEPIPEIPPAAASPDQQPEFRAGCWLDQSFRSHRHGRARRAGGVHGRVRRSGARASMVLGPANFE